MKTPILLTIVSLALLAGCVGSADEPVDPPAQTATEEEKPKAEEKKPEEKKAKTVEENVQPQGVKDHSV